MVVEDWPPRGSRPPRTVRRRAAHAARTDGIFGRDARPHHDLPRPAVCACARDAADLAAQVRVTVLHEVGHYFGMSDERLRELGWA